MRVSQPDRQNVSFASTPKFPTPGSSQSPANLPEPSWICRHSYSLTPVSPVREGLSTRGRMGTVGVAALAVTVGLACAQLRAGSVEEMVQSAVSAEDHRRIVAYYREHLTVPQETVSHWRMSGLIIRRDVWGHSGVTSSRSAPTGPPETTGEDQATGFRTVFGASDPLKMRVSCSILAWATTSTTRELSENVVAFEIAVDLRGHRVPAARVRVSSRRMPLK